MSPITARMIEKVCPMGMNKDMPYQRKRPLVSFYNFILRSEMLAKNRALLNAVDVDMGKFRGNAVQVGSCSPFTYSNAQAY